MLILLVLKDDLMVSYLFICFQVTMCAPDILIPIKSTNKLVYLAHLGTLKLVNFFKRDASGRLIDHLHFELTDLKLNRARVAEDIESNEIEGEIEVIKPINFNLGKITTIYF